VVAKKAKNTSRLVRCTSCCISQWPSQWGWANFDPPQLRNRLTDLDEIRILELSPKYHPPCKISLRSHDVGGFGEYPVCHCQVSFFVFFYFWSLRHAHRSHRWTDFDDLYVVMTSSHSRMCLLGVSLICLPIRRSNTPKTRILGMRTGVFQPNWQKSKNVHIIKIIASIPTKFCMHSDKDHQMPFVGGPNTFITDPRWRPAAILE